MILSDDINKCHGVLSSPLGEGLELRVSSDSRKLEKENCFLSLYGENFDSFKFLPQVIEKGVDYILLENKRPDEIKSLQSQYPKTTFVIVEDIFKFILELSRVRSERFQKSGGKVIGLTGSNGKTTNKEILKSLLSLIGVEKIHATKGNLNNQIGVPLTIFDLEDRHEVAIVEMGTNFPGEIEVLARAANPQYGFITNIGYAHIEFLKSLEGVFEEKTALYREIAKREDGLFLINGFDERLQRLKSQKSTLFLSEDDVDFKGSGFKLNWSGHEYEVNHPKLLGRHQKINMAMCMALSLEIFPQLHENIVEKAQNYQAPDMNRGEIREFLTKKVYLDAYNANPSSMRASLESFLDYLGTEGIDVKNALPVLGDMNELGEEGPSLHLEIGKLLKEKGFNRAIFVGRYGSSYADGFGRASKCFSQTFELKEKLPTELSSCEILFIKGSRSLQLESILDING